MDILSDSDSDHGNQVQPDLTINEHYAKAFSYRKEREELEKLKEKYGSDYNPDGSDDSDSESDDSESDESEDEDGEELTPAVDAAILRTLARIKSKDPGIYEGEKDIFEEERQKTGNLYSTRTSKPKDKSKPIKMHHLVLESALNPDSRSPSPAPQFPYVEEQRALRDETIAAFKAAEGTKEDDLFIPRARTKDEVEEGEEAYRAFLEREVGGIEIIKGLVDADHASAPLNQEESAVEGDTGTKENKKKKKKPSGEITSPGVKETDQEFLMNYILNRGWIDKSTTRIPTYNEIISNNKGKGKPTASDQGDEDEDKASVNSDDFEEIVDRFESSYNFRFEEPDAGTIKSYPRTLPSLVRRTDTSRKEARERRKERKEQEKAQRREEVKRLKRLKLGEIRRKLERIAGEGGIKSVEESEALQDLDLDGEWDPEAHDRQMDGLYGGNDNAFLPDEDADEKPQWEDDIDIGGLDIPDIDQDAFNAGDAGPSNSVLSRKKKKKKKGKGEDDDDEGVDVDAMDADLAAEIGEEWDGTEEMRKSVLDKYMEELYGLDFNDVVAGQPTRFKYTSVAPQAFALSPAEILMATDAELNQYMSVKRYAPYRKDRWDQGRGERLKELKDKIKERAPPVAVDGGWGNNNGQGSKDVSSKKRKGKKERMKAKVAVGMEGNEGDVLVADGGRDGTAVSIPASGSGNEKKRKRKREMFQDTSVPVQVEESGVKKKRRRQKRNGVPSEG